MQRRDLVRLATLTSAVVIALGSGCRVDTSVPGAAHVTCGSGGECPAGFTCRTNIGVCVSSDDGDVSPPTVSGVSFSRQHVGIDGEVTISFAVSEPLFAAPRVEMGFGAARGTCQLGSIDGLRYTYVYTASGGEPQSTITVLATLIDAAGNEAVDVALGTLTFDFVRPQVRETAVDREAVAAGDTVTLTFRIDEALDGAPLVTLDGASFTAAASSEAQTYRHTYVATGHELEGAASPIVHAVDLAGNTSTTTLDALFVLDFTAPALAEAPNVVRPVARDTQVAGVVFTVTEALAGPPRVQLVASGGGGAVDMTLGEKLGSTYTFTRPVTQQDADGSYDVRLVEYQDLAGNAGAELSLGAVRIDNTSPDVSGALLTPSLAKAGADVTASFTVSEALARDPVVTLGGAPMTLGARTNGTYTYVRTVLGGDGEGVKAVSAELADDAGNLRFVTLGQITVDLSPPAIAAANLIYTAHPDNPLQSVTRATDDTLITVVVVPDEALSVEPGDTPLLTATNGIDTLIFTVAAFDDGSVVFEAQPEGMSDGLYVPALTWTDVAGNTADAASFTAPLIRVKTSAPELMVEQTKVTYWRSPWGNGASETLGSFVVPAGPYFALAPGDPLSTSSVIAPQAFSLVDGEALARVRVWADAGLFSFVGTVTPNADGSWPRQRLANLDAPTLYVTGLDAAGNESAPVEITSTEWVATPKAPAHGVSPHALTVSALAGGALRPDAGAISAPDQAVSPDGDAAHGKTHVAWQRRYAVEISPGARAGHAIAYDSARGRVVLFGGGGFGAVQEWDGRTWSEPLLPSVRPSASHNHAMAYDSARQRVVLFGGLTGSGERLDEVWEWDGKSWHGPFTPATRPSARHYHTMIYDSARERTVIFGGFDAGGIKKDDVWEWDGASWHGPFTPATRPSARTEHTMAYDGARGRTVIFGGFDASGRKNDVWEWDGTSWHGPFTPATRPSARPQSAMAYDSVRGRVVLFGGWYDTFNELKDDVWEWDGASWHGPFTPPNRPSARSQHAMTYDIARARVILVGGYDEASYQEDLWEWDGARWEGPFVASARPGARSGPLMFYDDARERAVLIGGVDASSMRRDDVWEWNGASWSGPIEPATRPSARILSALAYDAGRGVAVLFGGLSDAAFEPTDDTWEWDGTDWSGPLYPATRPGARFLHAMTYDSDRGLVVLFGGADADSSLDDLWELNGSSWDGPFVPAERPTARVGHALAYDSARQRVVLFGGRYGFGQYLDDVWEWDGASWHGPFTPPTRPVARAWHALAYDDARERVVLFGGEPSVGQYLDDAWEWDGASWDGPFTPAAGPSARMQHHLLYDGARERVVLFGGSGLTGTADDVWEWDVSPSHRPAVQLMASYAGQAFTHAAVTGLRVRAHCGGLYAPFDGAAVGATLLGWHMSGPGAPSGSWVPLGSNATGVDPAQPHLPSPSASLLSWSAGTAAEAQRYFVDDPGLVSFRCEPSGVSGDGFAEVALDYIEVRVRYDAP